MAIKAKITPNTQQKHLICACITNFIIKMQQSSELPKILKCKCDLCMFIHNVKVSELLHIQHAKVAPMGYNKLQ